MRKRRLVKTSAVEGDETIFRMIQATALKEGHSDIFSLLQADNILSPSSADNTEMSVKITLKKKHFMLDSSYIVFMKSSRS